MRLCSYVVRVDAGLAPNPFWGYCTLAVCTPNHMGIRVQKGDWFMGTQPISKGAKLIYAMEVSKILSFDTYYHDPRFERKKPKIKGPWKELRGDNMYYRDDQGKWQQHPTWNHPGEEQKMQDLKHPYVFISEHFYYFGENAIEIPVEYAALIRKRQGCKCSHAPELVRGFLSWLVQTQTPGVHGDPIDQPVTESGNCSGTSQATQLNKRSENKECA